MIPIITVVCIVGSYSTSNSMYGVIVMFLSGIVGYLLNKNNFPSAPDAVILCTGTASGEQYA
ncbi:MAG: tripartite tricarboxylate transporter permease [Clostridium sp.]